LFSNNPNSVQILSTFETRKYVKRDRKNIHKIREQNETHRETHEPGA